MKSNYYTLDRILKEAPDAIYYVLIGERSNGKTFACLEKIIKDYLKDGTQGVYLRRMGEDVKGRRAMDLFAPFINNPTKGEYLKKLSKGKYVDVQYYGQSWHMVFEEKDEKTGKVKLQMEKRPFCYRFALNEGEHDKGTSYPLVKTIFFDEFVTDKWYLPDEFKVFQNMLSTIIRDRDDVKIFMCGNTISKHSPYFGEMGLTHVKDMQKGDLEIYNLGNTKNKIAVEFTTTPTGKKKSDKFFAFDNPEIKMITTGAWSISPYPRLPYDYAPCDVLFTYFIVFDKEIFQCEIISVKNTKFTFIHRKTTPLKNEDEDLIYSTEFDPRRNHARLLNRPRYKIEKIVWSYFQRGQVFYASNDVGDMVRHYLDWCSQQYL